MVRRIVTLAMLAFSFFVASSGTQAQDPYPECNPCPWIR
jgi:hypothetical protein